MPPRLSLSVTSLKDMVGQQGQGSLGGPLIITEMAALIEGSVTASLGRRCVFVTPQELALLVHPVKDVTGTGTGLLMESASHWGGSAAPVWHSIWPQGLKCSWERVRVCVTCVLYLMRAQREEMKREGRRSAG